MQQGQIILLNGTSSAGKSTIAKALQERLEPPYLHTGIDYASFATLAAAGINLIVDNVICDL